MEGYFANAHRQHRDRHEQRRNHHHRYSSHSDESRGGGSTQIRRTKSQESESSVNYLAQQLQQTGSFDYNQNRASYQPNGDDRRHHIFEDDKENDEDSFVGHVYSPNQPSISKNKKQANRASMEHAYMNAMKQMNRGDYGPAIRKTKSQDYEKKAEKKKPRDRRHTAPPVNNRRITSIGTQTAKDDDLSTTAAVPINVNKRSVSKKDPSEEIIAIFGAYGITGQYFLQQSIEAGYNVKALILPGMDMGDIASYRSLRLITGSLGEEDKIREVVRDATYVVCLLNDCDHENFNPPVGIAANDTHMAHFDFNNLNFMHNLVPILEDSKTCRVLLYEASSVSIDNKGSAPFISKIVKRAAVKKDWKMIKKEQDKIVRYITAQTKNAHFNYIITRPSGAVWDKPSKKKLAASKSQPGPFPITNTDLAEFTLSALKMEKVYNSCPYVVQDGI